MLDAGTLFAPVYPMVTWELHHIIGNDQKYGRTG